LYIGVALAVVGGLLLVSYSQMVGSQDGTWGLISLLIGCLVIYLTATWRADPKSLLYKRGLLVGPGLTLVLWGAGMLSKVHNAPGIVTSALAVGVILAAVGGLGMVVIGERRRSRAA
jgi:hypothetical protein